MQNKFYNITIALAGMVQAVSLVKELAQAGTLQEQAYEASIYSIFQTEPNNIAAVYGGLPHIKFGLEKLLNLLESSPLPVQARYLLSLIHLQKKISRSSKMIDILTQRIEQAKKQVIYFSLLHPTVITNLADIYICTLSTFKFRIIIWGNQRHLNVATNMEKIRALLLAGVRSCTLWRQVGGSRFQLLFSRAKIKTAAQKILADILAEEKLHHALTHSQGNI